MAAPRLILSIASIAISCMPLQGPPLAAQDLVQREQAAFRAAADAVSSSVVQIQTFGSGQRAGEELQAAGPTTGTIVSADGWIITSLFSFREQPASILVVLPNGKRAAARIVARDFSRDLALLKIDANNLPVPQFATSEGIQVGQWAIALGKTYDEKFVSESVGIVSARGRAYGKALQVDCKVSPINYGGPLIDLGGRVLGILSPIAPGTFLEGDSAELYDSGIGFAIPAADVLARLEQMQSGEDIYSGKLGIVSDSTNELAGPVVISGATPGSPAAKVGVMAQDQLIAAAGKPVEMLANLQNALGPLDAGQTFQFSILRQGQVQEYQCELAKEIPVYYRRYLGLRLADLPAEQGQPALAIAAIEPDSPAASSALQVGQRILRCNQQAMPSRQDLRRIIAVAELDTPITFEVAAPNEAEGTKADGTEEMGPPQTIELLPALWPTELAPALPQSLTSVGDSKTPASPSQEETPQPDASAEKVVEIAEISLGDFPNTAYAVVPLASNARPLGLLILFPEPGDLSQEKAQAYWQEFCVSQGWIVAVLNSGDPRRWSREEVDLAARILGKLENAYELDKQRIVLGGIGVGGKLALVAAAAQVGRVTGVATLGTELKNIGLRVENAPLRSLDFLLLGTPSDLNNTAKSLRDLGYSAIVVDAPKLTTGSLESIPAAPLTRWLEGLGRL